MIEPDILTIGELADRWQQTPLQIVHHALALRVPLYFPFEGLVFDVSDDWHRHGGDWQQSRELEALSESIPGREAWIKRSARGENGEYEQRLTSEDAQALRLKIEADKSEQTALTELLEQRSIERNRCEYRGYLRAAPSTLWDIVTTGAAQFPHKAFHPHSPIHIATLPDRNAQVWDGRMVALEPGPGRDRYKKDTLTADDLCAFMVEVKAIEAHQAAKQQAAPEPQAAAPAPVVAESANDAPVDGITTAQVAAIFDGMPYTAENWPRRLSDTKWLEPAQVALGAQGGASSQWNPATLARLIHGKERGTAKQKTLEALNRKFKSKPVLAPWRTAWDEHYDMFNDADGSH